MAPLGPPLESGEAEKIIQFIIETAIEQKSRDITIPINDLAKHFSSSVVERSHVTNRIRWQMDSLLRDAGIVSSLKGAPGYNFILDNSIEIDFAPQAKIERHESRKKVSTFTDFEIPFLPPTYFNTLISVLEAGDRPILIGPKGCGKSRSLEEAFACRGIRAIRIALGEINDPTKLTGNKEIINEDGVPVTKLIGGLVREAAESGTAVIFDELDSASPNVGLALNRILESNTKLVLDTEHGTEIMTPKKGYALAATANTWGYGDESGEYEGVYSQNRATWDRLHPKIDCDYDMEIEKQLISPFLPKAVVDAFYKKGTTPSGDGIVLKIRRAIKDPTAPIEDSLSMRTIIWFAQRFNILGWHKTSYYFVNEFKPEYRMAMTKIITDLLGSALTPSINDYDAKLPHYIPNAKSDLISAGFMA